MLIIENYLSSNMAYNLFHWIHRLHFQPGIEDEDWELMLLISEATEEVLRCFIELFGCSVFLHIPLIKIISGGFELHNGVNWK